MTAEHHETHRVWEELAAAHALHALEPSEELRLLAHVDTCQACLDRVDEFALVAAQLGALADDESQPPRWAQMRERVVDPSSSYPQTEIAPLPLRRRYAARMLAAAAAVVVAGTGVAVGSQLFGGHPSSASAALTACRQQSGCQVIQLHGQRGDNAAVLVEAGHASLVPVKLPPAAADHVYVLWQLPRDGSPNPVVAFSDSTRQTSSVPLVTGFSDTAAFAVSMEPAGPMPTRPTDVLAVGAATT